MNIDWKLIKEKYPNALNKCVEYYHGADIKDCCYCDLEKFFDDNGIIIEIRYIIMYWEFQIFKSDGSFIYENNMDFNSRQETKKQAIYKSFEILENNIENNK